MGKNSVEEKIKETIERLRIFIQNDGGDLEFVSYDKGILTIKILGACVDCPFIDQTFDDGVKEVLMNDFKEIKDVVFVK
ncbi:MAG: NifU family protein [Mycoplasmataceae bacterium]|jgi:Fe-S cluster biogenesis protein NfuA|nr:NifU family protein [Mycoplasmataceae bacterium]